MTTSETTHLQPVDSHPALSALAQHYDDVEEISREYDVLSSKIQRLVALQASVTTTRAGLESAREKANAERGKVIATGFASADLAGLDNDVVQASKAFEAAEVALNVNGGDGAITTALMLLRAGQGEIQSRIVDAARKRAGLLLAVAEERISACAPALKAALGAAVEELATFAALCEARDQLAKNVPGTSQCGGRAISISTVLPRIQPLADLPDLSVELRRLVQGRVAGVLTEIQNSK
jgi:hypothetical protein